MNSTIAHPGSVWGVYPERQAASLGRGRTLLSVSGYGDGIQASVKW